MKSITLSNYVTEMDHLEGALDGSDRLRNPVDRIWLRQWNSRRSYIELVREIAGGDVLIPGDCVPEFAILYKCVDAKEKNEFFRTLDEAIGRLKKWASANVDFTKGSAMTAKSRRVRRLSVGSAFASALMFIVLMVVRMCARDLPAQLSQAVDFLLVFFGLGAFVALLSVAVCSFRDRRPGAAGETALPAESGAAAVPVKHRKLKAALAAACVLAILVGIVVGVVCLDGSGVLYGAGAISYKADGTTYTETAVHYNEYVCLKLPAKPGYDILGVRDTKSGELLFNGEGISNEKVKRRDLSDFADRDLEVVYELHHYAATIQTANGVTATAFTFTVEDEPEDVIEDPQLLDGYLFDGWFTDPKFKKPFSGDFGDYIDEPLVLYPHYRLDGWTITWDLQGGEMLGGAIDSYTILTDVALPKGDLVKKRGYVLVGWAVNGKLVDYFPATNMEDMTLVAVWKPQVYTLTYQPEGGEMDRLSEEFTIEEPLALLTPVRAAYRFEGWYTNRAYQTQVTEIEAGTVGDMTVYAKWTPVEYHITYDLNGGTENSALNPTVYTVEKDIVLAKPQRRGYDFVGWAVNGKLVDYFPATNMEDMTLVAVWKPQVYTLTYQPEGGEMDRLSEEFTVEEAFALLTPVRAAYRFEGWFTNRAYQTQVTEIEAGTVGDMTVYAKWTPVEYHITYDLNGGTENSPFNPTVYTVEKDVKLAEPKRKGYRFQGWYDREGEPKTDLSADSDGDVFLTAFWTAKEYTVTVYPDNGQAPEFTQTVTFDAYYCITPPSVKGYSMAGLTLGGQAFDAVGVYTYDFDARVVAHYEAREYRITYISDGETIYTQTVTYGQAYSLYLPGDKPDREFAGWYDDPIAGKRVSDGVYERESNLALYASWLQTLTIDLESGSDYTIDKTIEKAYLVGNYTGDSNLMVDICISIPLRDTDLTLCLINVGFKAKENRDAIDCENSSYTLTVLLTGKNYIEGGDGSDGADGTSGKAMTESNRNGAAGKTGCHALDCGTVIFASAAEDSALTLKGGDGGDGGDGGVDTDRSRMWLNYTPDGGQGADSGSALNCVSYRENGISVQFEKGAAGRGGRRGSRGDWWRSACYGQNGSDGKQSDAVSYK